MAGRMKNPATPKHARWVELVEECKGRTAWALWAVGDAALEIAPMGAHGGDRKSNQQLAPVVETNLRRFAVEIDRSYDRVLQLRRVAHAGPEDRRLLNRITAGTIVDVHEILMAEEYQPYIEPGMTREEARSLVAQLKAEAQAEPVELDLEYVEVQEAHA